MLTEFDLPDGETVKVQALLILGNNGKFYTANHYHGLDGLRLVRYEINADDAFKGMKETAKNAE